METLIIILEICAFFYVLSIICFLVGKFKKDYSFIKLFKLINLGTNFVVGFYVCLYLSALLIVEVAKLRGI